MQEEITHKVLTLCISATKLTARELGKSMKLILSYARKKHQENNLVPHGRTTMKKLVSQNEQLKRVDLDETDIRTFDKTARKYSVGYSVMKDTTGDEPKYFVFFKAKDESAILAAFDEYTKNMEKNKSKESVIDKLNRLKKEVRNQPQKGKEKELEL